MPKVLVHKRFVSFRKGDGIVYFRTDDGYSGSQPINHTADATIQFLRRVLRAHTFEVIDA